MMFLLGMCARVVGGLAGSVFQDPGGWCACNWLAGLPSARGGGEGAFPASAPLRKQVSHLILKDPGMGGHQRRLTVAICRSVARL